MKVRKKKKKKQQTCDANNLLVSCNSVLTCVPVFGRSSGSLCQRNIMEILQDTLNWLELGRF